jgi:hypothetical protein
MWIKIVIFAAGLAIWLGLVFLIRHLIKDGDTGLKRILYYDENEKDQE